VRFDDDEARDGIRRIARLVVAVSIALTLLMSAAVVSHGSAPWTGLSVLVWPSAGFGSGIAFVSALWCFRHVPAPRHVDGGSISPEPPKHHVLVSIEDPQRSMRGPGCRS
jgi:hypothetical protein